MHNSIMKYILQLKIFVKFVFHDLLYCRVYLCYGKVAAYTDDFCNEQGDITGCYFIDARVQYKSCGQTCNGSLVSFETKQKCDSLCYG